MSIAAAKIDQVDEYGVYDVKFSKSFDFANHISVLLSLELNGDESVL